MTLSFLIRRLGLSLALAIAGCSSVEKIVDGDKVDYRGAKSTTVPLDVPPDLTQLASDSRYQPQGGSVSAAAIEAASPEPPGAGTSAVAVHTIGQVRIERLGNERWLSTSKTPEELWPLLRTFWQEHGFSLEVDQPAIGVMETQWAENRAKLPKDPIRNVLGKVLDSLYSTGERDKFRTRVERTASGSEVYISHRGMVEVYTNAQKDATKWQPRPVDRQIEAEFLARLLQKLGVKAEQAQTMVASGANNTPARARVVEGRAAATLQLDDNFDRAWRRVGLALDRGGFTVEDRNRAQGVYFVRYIDPTQAAKEEPGFFSRLFSFGKKDEVAEPMKYRVNVTGSGNTSTVSVSDSGGAPDNSETGKRIVTLLLEELK